MTEKKETKKLLEREYVIPLRPKYNHVPRYKKTPKAVKTVKEFIAKHMKVEERDLKKVKIDKYLNEMMWFRGIKKPPYSIKVKATKQDNGNVLVEAVELMKSIEFKKARMEKRDKKAVEGIKTKPVEKKEEKIVEENKEEVSEEDKKEIEEKQESVKESGNAAEKEFAKEAKHTTGGKHKENVHPRRQVMNK